MLIELDFRTELNLQLSAGVAVGEGKLQRCEFDNQYPAQDTVKAIQGKHIRLKDNYRPPPNYSGT